MLRILGAGFEPPRVLSSFPDLLTACRRVHARQATLRASLVFSRTHLTVSVSAALPELAEPELADAMSHQQGHRGGRGPNGPMRNPAAGDRPQLQQHGAANGSGGHAKEARAAAAGNRTSSTTKAHLTNVRFDGLDISANTKRCVLHQDVYLPVLACLVDQMECTLSTALVHRRSHRHTDPAHDARS